jgi:hypothetical protein
MLKGSTTEVELSSQALSDKEVQHSRMVGVGAIPKLQLYVNVLFVCPCNNCRPAALNDDVTCVGQYSTSEWFTPDPAAEGDVNDDVTCVGQYSTSEWFTPDPAAEGDAAWPHVPASACSSSSSRHSSGDALLS